MLENFLTTMTLAVAIGREPKVILAVRHASRMALTLAALFPRPLPGECRKDFGHAAGFGDPRFHSGAKDIFRLK